MSKIKRPEVGKTLKEIAIDMGFKSEKSIYQARRRWKHRVADRQTAGESETEPPFPEPVRVYRGVSEYWDKEIIDWMGSHTLADNPSRHRKK